jgi:hypothetical protein
MNFAKTAASATVLCLMLGATGAYAESSEPANAIGCLHMEKKVSAALDAGQQSANYSAAREQARNARDACMIGLYKTGISEYSNVLKILSGT